MLKPRTGSSMARPWGSTARKGVSRTGLEDGIGESKARIGGSEARFGGSKARIRGYKARIIFTKARMGWDALRPGRDALRPREENPVTGPTAKTALIGGWMDGRKEEEKIPHT